MGVERIEKSAANQLEGRHRGAGITEEQKMRGILQEYEPRLGRYELVQVGDAGWIVMPQGRIPKQKPGVVVNLDLDDTLIQSSQIKKLRKQYYTEFLQERGIEVESSNIDALMEESYRFVQGRVGKGNYLTENHAEVLASVTSELQKSDNANATAQRVVDTLTRMEADGVRDTDPFVITDGFVTAKEPSDSLPALQKMFHDTLAQTPPFRNTVDAAVELMRRRDAGAAMHVNLFSLGYPPEQLLKSFGLMARERGEAMQPDYIFLTKVAKNEFLTQLIEDGHIFGNEVIDVDDSIVSLNTKLAVVDFFREHTGAEMRFVRLRRGDTKDGHYAWQEKRENDLEITVDSSMTGAGLADRILGEGTQSVARIPTIPLPQTDLAA